MTDFASATVFIDGEYRYTLTRVWDDLPTITFVLLNPSTADALVDDPTIRRCMGFAARNGFGGITVRNLFAFRATDPRELATAHDPVGAHNDEYLERLRPRRSPWPRDGADQRLEYPTVVVAWGANPAATPDRVSTVVDLMHGTPLLSLGPPTRSGAPRHPLYLAGDTPLQTWIQP